MNRKRILFLIINLSILMNNIVSAQDRDLSELIMTVAEELAADDEDPEGIAQYITRLHELAANPVNLNSADEQELTRLFFLSVFQIKSLTDYVHSSGKVYSVFEIANIPGFDRETAEMLSPFIKLEALSEPFNQKKRLKNSLLTNLTTKPGAKEPSDLGSPLKVLGKYRYDAGSFTAGATIEKDPGEKMFTGNPKLPDFTSAYLGYEGKGIIRKLIIGDYSASFGQGLNLNTGLSVGSSLSSRGYVPVRNELKEYTSTDENNFFRGTAAQLKYKNISGVFYLSSNSIDASISTHPGESASVENLYLAGYHNTASLLRKKDVLRENSAGANISYSFKQAGIGVTWSADKLSMPLMKDDSDLSDLYAFSGSIASGYSLYYNAMLGRIFLFGEAASNDRGKKAYFQGISMRPSDRLTFNLFYRNYQPGYYSLHGRNQGSSSGWNENSLSAAFTFEAAKHLFFSGGADLIHYPWLKYRTSSPSSAFRDELRLSYLPTGKLTCEVLYQYRMSMADSSEITGVPVLEETRTTYFKASVKYEVSEKLTLAMRADHKVVNSTGDKGMLVSADMSLKPGKLPLSFWMRYCIFSIDDWKARIYTYENDLLYSYSVPALSGNGSRSYVMVKWDLGKNIDLRLKYGLTVKDQVNTDEVKFQVRMVF